MIFSEIENDFKRFLRNGIMGDGSARSNASRINYLIEIQYSIDDLSDNAIERIQQRLIASKAIRAKYRDESGIASLTTALRHLQKYLKARENAEKARLENAERQYDERSAEEANILKTVTIREIEARLGQGKFRKAVREVWKDKCSFTGVGELGVLTASHIRPWKNCSDEERLDGNNGLLLVPNYDKLFDKGYITINPSTFKLEASSQLTEHMIAELKVDLQIVLPLNDRQKFYMEHHRVEVFDKCTND